MWPKQTQFSTDQRPGVYEMYWWDNPIKGNLSFNVTPTNHHNSGMQIHSEIQGLNITLR